MSYYDEEEEAWEPFPGAREHGWDPWAGEDEEDFLHIDVCVYCGSQDDLMNESDGGVCCEECHLDLST